MYPLTANQQANSCTIHKLAASVEKAFHIFKVPRGSTNKVLVPRGWCHVRGKTQATHHTPHHCWTLASHLDELGAGPGRPTSDEGSCSTLMKNDPFGSDSHRAEIPSRATLPHCSRLGKSPKWDRCNPVPAPDTNRMPPRR